ncbi:RecQ family ATP-dependent DNA helicase [Cryomorphaceae bacterium]|nr:RecQ family ATP-dependent DNA helicase [Cryomorphaceae bacterium]
MSAQNATPLEVLQKYWGYDGFREPQEQIIEAVLEGRDTLALMPTGGGKSLCFQIPTLCRPGMTLVISPLIALMNDQVKALQDRGIRAIALTSELDHRQTDLALENAMTGAISFLYLSPERLRTEIVRARLPQMPIELIAVDEAHCISEWGYDFRPAYRLIKEVRSWLPKVPVLALTASATPDVVEDIQEQLEFEEDHIIRKSFARENLAYRVWPTRDKFGAVQALLSEHEGPGIIYVRNRRKTQEIGSFLQRRGLSAQYYHAGVDPAEKAARQSAWTKNEVRVMVATNAFGMGIDKPDVRWVLHWEPADCIESYFQEAGRAGRDGKDAVSYVFYDARDGDQLYERYVEQLVTEKDVHRHYDALMNYLHLPIGSGAEQSFDLDLKEFARHYEFDLYGVYQTIDLLDKDGFWHLSDGYKERSYLHITASNRSLYEARLRHPLADKVIQFLLRSYPGITEEGAHIDENRMAAKLGATPKEIRKELEQGQAQELWSYKARPAADRLWMTIPRQNTKHLPWNRKALSDLRSRKEERIGAMVEYLELASGCRSAHLLAYFGERGTEPCGKCDLCLGRKDLNDDALWTYLKGSQREWNQVMAHYPGKSEEIQSWIRIQVEAGRLHWEGPELVVVNQEKN